MIFSLGEEETRQQGIAYIKELIAKHGADKLHDLQVWSGGGDGTVMWVFDMLKAAEIDVERLNLCCIPFGTGNDFSQALGWQKTIGQPLQSKLPVRLFVDYIGQRLTEGSPVDLDIWEVSVTAYDDGYIQHVTKDKSKHKERENGSPVTSVKEEDEEVDESLVASGVQVGKFKRNMVAYLTIGLQGQVGTGFEQKRTGTRFGNYNMYALETSKLFLTGVQPVTYVMDNIELADGTKVLQCDNPAPKSELMTSPVVSGTVNAPVNLAKGFMNMFKKLETSVTKKKPEDDLKDATPDSFLGEVPSGAPFMRKNPIEMFVQNVPRVWGRPIDFWNMPMSKGGDTSVVNRAGPTDPANWTQQMAQDGKLEVFAMTSIEHYLKNVMDPSEVSRIGQFEKEFQINFRHQADKRIGTTHMMIDGEFYQLCRPKAIRLIHKVRPRYIAKSDSKIVQDQLMLETKAPLTNAFLFDKRQVTSVMGAGSTAGSKPGTPRGDKPAVNMANGASLKAPA